MLRILDGDTVRALYPIADAVADMADALVRFSAGETYQHPRVTAEPPGEGGLVLVMPAATAGSVGLKVLSMYPRAAERGLPAVQGLIVLLDATYGEPLAVLDGIAVTEIRTAAVTALATDRLAPPDAAVLGVVGAGVQARAHLAGLAPLRPWKQVRVFGPTPDRVAATVAYARDQGLPAEPAGSATDAVAGADVVCTVTSASRPVLADAAVAERNVHVNAIGAFGAGARELPTALVRRARLVVDSREAALREAGDLLVPIAEGALGPDAVTAELGEVLAGTAPGRLGDEVTVFKSLGLAIEDLVAGGAVLRRAVERDAGTRIRFP